ncbi:MAG: AraC family transcriptional regulator [Treponema sp.]|jgi:AraC-like DNA-binding protein|nr:AraC family transcriptional regulator [Treponema sp.]
MDYIIIKVPPYPYFVYSGDALYRPGDFHRKRAGIESFDLLFVEQGGLYMKIEDNLYHVKKGDVLIIPPGKAHVSYKVCDEQTYFHWLHFNITEAFQLSDSFNTENKTPRKSETDKNHAEVLVLPVFQSITDNDVMELTQILNNLESLRVNKYFKSSLVSKESNPNTPIRNQAQFLNLLSYLTKTNEFSNSPEIASMLMNYLKANYESKISLHSMAKAANCHPTHVIRCFKKKYQTTPVKALVNIRLLQSKRLLQSTNLSCEEIAYKVGFSSASYFSKLFKEHARTTPQEYRKTQQESSK